MTESLVRKLVEDSFPGTQLPDIEIAKLGIDEALGFISQIFRVTFAEHDGTALPKSVIVKIASISESREVWDRMADNDPETMAAFDKGQHQILKTMHRVECECYSIFEKAPTKPLKIAKPYRLVNSEALKLIVMEDFDGCKTIDVVEGLNENQLFAVIEEIAKLHAFAFNASGWRNIGMTTEELIELTKDHNVMLTCLQGLIAEDPEKFSELRRIEEKAADPLAFGEMTERYKKDEHIGILVHGDLWSPQLLWRQGDTDKLVGIVDWQMAHAGSPVEDLQHLLYTSTSLENRKRLTLPLLKYYYRRLGELLGDRKVPFTFDELKADYCEQLQLALMLCSFASFMWSKSVVINRTTDDAENARRKTTIYERTASLLQEFVEFQETGRLHLLQEEEK